MGTRGYKVYRYKQRYLAIYSQCDSYPDVLGEEMLASARKDLKAYFETNPREMKDTAPQVDVFIEWVYEIDLDWEIFHINHVPFFTLNNLPPRGVDLSKLVGKDSYGNKVCLDEKYRFETIQPLVYDDAALRPYHQLLANGQSSLSYIDMLELSDHITQGETLRVRYLQTIVGYSMDRTMAFAAIQEFRLAKDGSEISNKAWHEAFAFASAAFEPPIYFSFRKDSDPQAQTESPCPQLPERRDVCWVRRDVFIHITPHLTDENNMQAAIACVVEEVLKQDKEGIAFGVLFSFFHCVLARIDLTAGGAFIHTLPMAFLPSRFAKEPSTPGITALSRFGYRRDPDLFVKALAFHSKTKEKSGVTDEQVQAQAVGDLEVNMSESAEPSQIPSTTSLSIDSKSNSTQEHRVPLALGSKKIPLEIWHCVALFLPSIDSLLEFGLVAKVCQEAVEMVLQCPHIDNWRLVGVDDTYTSVRSEDPFAAPGPTDGPRIIFADNFRASPSDPNDNSQDSQPGEPKPQLRCTKFLAIRDNSYAELWLGKRRTVNNRANMIALMQAQMSKKDNGSYLRVFPTVRKHRGVPLGVVMVG